MRDNKKLKNDNLVDAFINAGNGVVYAIKTQVNIRIQLIIAVLVIIASIIFNINTIETIFVVFAIFLVIFAEMANTAVETVVDLCTEVYNQKAKIAKDVSAGAVLILSINAVVVACFIFIKETLAIWA